MRHQLWVLDDRDAIEAIAAAVAAAPVVIADGHHRYETAKAYQAERRAENRHKPGPYDLILALIVELAEDQLTVGAIHRTVSGLPPGFDLLGACATWFDVVRAGPADERTLGALAEARSLSLVTGGSAYLLLPLEAAYEEAGNDLDSSLVAVLLSRLPEHESVHRHTVAEALGGARPRRGPGRLPPPSGHGEPDRELGGRAQPDAAEDDLLQSQAPHGDGVPLARSGLTG